MLFHEHGAGERGEQVSHALGGPGRTVSAGAETSGRNSVKKTTPTILVCSPASGEALDEVNIDWGLARFPHRSSKERYTVYIFLLPGKVPHFFVCHQIWQRIKRWFKHRWVGTGVWFLISCYRLDSVNWVTQHSNPGQMTRQIYALSTQTDAALKNSSLCGSVSCKGPCCHFCILWGEVDEIMACKKIPIQFSSFYFVEPKITNMPQSGLKPKNYTLC